ncbi:MAG: LysR family transcriptional regulator, partial [Eubacteriales bacterium]
SITRAAEKLYLAQPAVSLAVKELEEYYGIRLFDRISRRLYLTEAGRKMYDYAAHIVSLFDEMERNVKNWDSVGTIRVGSSITVGTCYMPGYVSLFCKKYPNCDVRVTIDSSDIIEGKILSGELDFAVIEGVSHSDSILSETLRSDRLVPVCAPDNTLASQSGVTPELFCANNFLLREVGSGTRELLDNALAAEGYSVTPSWESTSTTALINAVERGLGISVLPDELVREQIESGRIKSFCVPSLNFKRTFNIIHHKNKYLTEAAKNFLTVCRESVL